MEEIFWTIMIDFTSLIVPLVVFRIIFDYMRLFLFGGGN